MPTVYVVQENKNHNIVPATKFGEIKVLLPEGNVSFAIEDTYAKLVEGLEDMKDEDYLLLAGDPIAIGLATLVAYDSLDRLMTNEFLRFLKWDRQSQIYFEAKLKII